MKHLANLDLNKNQILNVALQNLASSPSSPVKGQIYFNTTDSKTYIHDGSGWVGVGANIDKSSTAPGSPTEGQMYYNTASKKLFYYNGTDWIEADGLGATMTGSAIITAINGSGSTIDDDNLSTNVNSAITNSHTHSNKAILDGTQESFTTTLKNKLDGIEASADVTDATNVGSAIYGSTAKTTPVDADTVAITNSSASNGLAKVTWANIKATLKTYFDTLYNNYVHPTGDGNSHLPVTSTTNNGKILTAGATANSFSWATNAPDWTNIVNKPTSTTSNIDSAVTNSHTHSNKTTLDTYTQTETNLADAVSKKHSQNTDTGTSSTSFTIGSTGVKIKNNSGTELQIRNNGDTAFADLRVNNLTVDGTTTTINSNDVNIGDNEILLNSDITTGATNSDGGLAVKRLMADNTTRKDAKFTFNNSIGRWQTTHGDVTGTLVTATVANKLVYNVGDGTATAITLTHNLNTQDVHVSLRESASPYAMVYTDIECASVNTVILRFSVAPTASQYVATIIG